MRRFLGGGGEVSSCFDLGTKHWQRTSRRLTACVLCCHSLSRLDHLAASLGWKARQTWMSCQLLWPSFRAGAPPSTGSMWLRGPALLLYSSLALQPGCSTCAHATQLSWKRLRRHVVVQQVCLTAWPST